MPLFLSFISYVPSTEFPYVTSFSQVAFDKLTVDSAHQQASAAVAAATAADQQAGFDIRMAKAEHDAGGMKASLRLMHVQLLSLFFSQLIVLCPSCLIFSGCL